MDATNSSELEGLRTLAHGSCLLHKRKKSAKTSLFRFDVMQWAIRYLQFCGQEQETTRSLLKETCVLSAPSLLKPKITPLFRITLSSARNWQQGEYLCTAIVEGFKHATLSHFLHIRGNVM
ncbi:hypothetical protein NECAME_15215 [Necator americanus]|uniref:Uncharacterized protein n=1 Tax=Necator americanus TaxID=51031 RepID=W2SL25_NECAM|nr:hypothetical protein NECAME_15215 [Necator americanus]ETN69576.1 hypothetical protein NECAME_15215 [Necator americanus]